MTRFVVSPSVDLILGRTESIAICARLDVVGFPAPRTLLVVTGKTVVSTWHIAVSRDSPLARKVPISTNETRG
jgi:hypothetical protein